MKTVSRISDIPKGEYYVAMEQVVTNIPGDERSRTNPGHGYPASTEYSMRFVVFESEDEMKGYVKEKQDRSYGNRNDYKILYVKVPTITTKVEVGVSL